MRLALLLLLTASTAAAQSVEARLADLRLATAVRLALVRDAATRALDVDVTARDGAVRLAPAPADALRVAGAVAGVRSVNGDAAPVAGVRPAAPRSETPRAEPLPDLPRAERERDVETDALRAEPPPAEPSRADVPRAETPRAETPRTEAPRPATAPPAAPRASAWGAPPRAEAHAEAPSETPAVHVVGRGETLFSLARRYGTTVEALRRLNGLGPTAGIEVGQRLRLR